MKCSELREIINQGKPIIVEFTKSVEDIEERFDRGMRAYVTNIAKPDSYNCTEVFFEERDFSEYNKSLEKAGWRNPSTGAYDLKFSELSSSKDYSGCVSFYEMEDDELCNFFILEDSSMKLFTEFKESKSKLNYVQWLESELIKSR
jgi:hypothetical protein